MTPFRAGFLVHAGAIMEHLNGVCEQYVTDCLMTTKTICVPGAGAVSMTFRERDMDSAMMDWAEKTGRAV